MDAATGRTGRKRINAFLEGFLSKVANGEVRDFSAYLDSICGEHIPNVTCKYKHVQRVLEREGIVCRPIDKYSGFERENWADVSDVQDKIAELRMENDSYTHPRQVKAEAEAVVLIAGLRNKSLISEPQVDNAYFVSFTRIVDDLAERGLPFTMRPEEALHWVSTIKPCTVEELGLLTNGLIGDLSASGLAVVDASKLQMAFQPLISACKSKLAEEKLKYRQLIAYRYGEEGARAFDETK